MGKKTYDKNWIIKVTGSEIECRSNFCGVILSSQRLEQADEFNCQFSDVFNKSELTQVPLPNRSAPFMENIHVLAEGVTKLLKGLNHSKA